MKFKNAYQQLNKEQRVAVDTIEGPVMVIAGPGTGKTQTLALRIANIIQKTDTPPHAILALTFTELGAKAMATRLADLIGPQAYYVLINTFHGFASAVIQEHPDLFEFTEQTQPISDLEKLQIITKIIDLRQFQTLKPAGAPHLYVKTLIKTIQDIKREGYTPESFENFLQHNSFFPKGGAGKDQHNSKQIIKLHELQTVFSLYEHWLKQSNRYDFEDMINHVTQAFSRNPELLLEYQERFHYFLADEYQDTNSAQNQLLFQIASYWGEQANIFVVGDPDQSIYRFQGASLENILNFRDKYPQAKIITLNNNYRSQQVILDAAYELIRPYKNSKPSQSSFPNQPLISQTNFPKSPINIASFPTPTLEYSYIANQIKQLIKSGTPPQEIAIIYRNNADSSEIADMLGRVGVKYNLEGGDNILYTGTVNRLLNIFKTIIALKDKKEDLDLFTILNYEFFNLDPLDILKLSRFASENRLNFLEAIENLKNPQWNSFFCQGKAMGGRKSELSELNNSQPNLPKLTITNYPIQNLAAIQSIIAMLINYSRFDTQATFTQTFEAIINQTGYLNWILSQSDSTRRLNQLNSLFRYLKQLNSTDHQLNIKKFLHIIDIMKSNYLSIPEDDLDIDIGAVRLTTAHKAKGREYEHVFIAKAHDGHWSNKRISELIKLPEELVIRHLGDSTSLNNKNKCSSLEMNEKQTQIAEERRLFYVALTRAKKTCTITWSDKYDTKQVVPTMFVYEIPDKFKQTIDTSKFQSQTNLVLKTIFKPQRHSELVLASKHKKPKEERDFLNKVLQDFKLNPTALNTYLNCPYKFKLDTLLHTPRAKPEHMAYGTAIHTALEKFFKKYKTKGEIPSTNYLLTVFNHSLEQEILNQNQLANWQSRGEKALRNYLKYYLDELVPPITTEKFIGSRLHPIYLDDIALTGKVDKIEYSSPPEGETRRDPLNTHTTNSSTTVRLIDYKTGQPKSKNEILGKTKNSDGGYYRQLIFYQLLTKLDQTFKYQVTETQLDFIEANANGKLKREIFKITKEEVENFKILIKDTMKKIRDHEFPRTTNYKICATCDYKNHCWPEGMPK